MKYDISCKVMSFAFSKMLKEYYQAHKPDFNVDEIIKNVRKEYKEMLIRTPGLSKDNYMKGNLKGAAYFLAMAKKVPDITPSELDRIIEVSFQSPFMIKMYAKKKKTGYLFSDKEHKRMLKDARRSQTSEDEMDWKFTYSYKENETSYTMTRCGVYQLAKRENLMDFLPCLCKMDYPKYKLQGATLKRSHTIANGDGECDFHLIKDE